MLGLNEIIFVTSYSTSAIIKQGSETELSVLGNIVVLKICSQLISLSVGWTQQLTSSLIKYSRYNQITFPVFGYTMTVVSTLDVCMGRYMCFIFSHILEEDSYHVRKWPGENSHVLRILRRPTERPNWQETRACQELGE